MVSMIEDAYLSVFWGHYLNAAILRFQVKKEGKLVHWDRRVAGQMYIKEKKKQPFIDLCFLWGV